MHSFYISWTSISSASPPSSYHSSPHPTLSCRVEQYHISSFTNSLFFPLSVPSFPLCPLVPRPTADTGPFRPNRDASRTGDRGRLHHSGYYASGQACKTAAPPCRPPGPHSGTWMCWCVYHVQVSFNGVKFGFLSRV